MTITAPFPVIEAVVNYVSPDTPHDKVLVRDSDKDTNNFEVCSTPVRIHDMRGEDWEHAFLLDTHGFMLQRAPTTDENLAAMRRLDHDHVKEQYYPECVALLKKLTGADRVVIFNHIVRLSSSKGTPSPTLDSKGTPAVLVHVDYSPNSVPAPVYQFLPEEDRAKLHSCRFQIINVWRPLMEPVQSWPLALTDYQSLHPDDLMDGTSQLSHPKPMSLPMSLFRHRDSHRWNYLSNQKTEEVLCFKTYESRTDVARFCAHTSFDNPLAKGAPPRESIEVRAIVFYPEE